MNQEAVVLPDNGSAPEAPNQLTTTTYRSRRAPVYLQDYVSGEGLSEEENEFNNLAILFPVKILNLLKKQ